MQNRSDEFKSLIKSEEDLREALQMNPNLITEQDEVGKTLLHYVATLSDISPLNVAKILEVLFNTPNLDFTIKDNDQNTPLHVVVSNCDQRIIYDCVLPKLLREAEKRNFDFSTLGNQGESVLHMAVRTQAPGIPHKANKVKPNIVKKMIDNVTNPGLDVLSSSGRTALFYAVNLYKYNEAHTLLDAGANPNVFEANACDPMTELENKMEHATQALSVYEYTDKDSIQANIDELNALKQKIMSRGEMKKNARILGVLANGAGVNTIFSHLPNEVLVKIVGHTKSSNTYKQADAEKIARQNLGRPEI